MEDTTSRSSLDGASHVDMDRTPRKLEQKQNTTEGSPAVMGDEGPVKAEQSAGPPRAETRALGGGEEESSREQ